MSRGESIHDRRLEFHRDVRGPLHERDGDCREELLVDCFDKKYGLFYRDKDYFNAKTENGEKVFWLRGNGWVIGGIPRTLPYLPKDNDRDGDYVKLFQTMAASIVGRQGDDGLWRANLDDPDQCPIPLTHDRVETRFDAQVAQTRSTPCTVDPKMMPLWDARRTTTMAVATVVAKRVKYLLIGAQFCCSRAAELYSNR